MTPEDLASRARDLAAYWGVTDAEALRRLVVMLRADDPPVRTMVGDPPS